MIHIVTEIYVWGALYNILPPQEVEVSNAVAKQKGKYNGEDNEK